MQLLLVERRMTVWNDVFNGAAFFSCALHSGDRGVVSCVFLVHDLRIDAGGHEGSAQHGAHSVPGDVALDSPLVVCGGEANVALASLGAQRHP